MSGGNDYTFQEGKENQQLTILTQLLRIVPTMRDMGEVFRWLATAIMQRFDVQLIQFWTLPIDQVGQRSAQLRAMAAQDHSLPERAVVNEQITQTVTFLASEPSPPTPQPMEQLFPYYHASLLKRFGLNYWTHCSLDSSIALRNHPYDRAAPRLLITAVLFLRQPAHADPVPTIRAILEQALVMAESRGILAPEAPFPRQSAPPPQPFPRQPPPPPPISHPPSQPPPLRQAPPPRPAAQPEVPPLTDLIPRRKQDPDLMMSSNPFASPIAISDKQARRLHAAIDGRKTVAELCNSLGMDLHEALAALQVLLTQRRIELYGPDGRLLDAAYLQKYR